jgi:RNA-binding protein
LRKLGVPHQISSSKNAITKINDTSIPKIGAIVVNEKLKPLGKILDIFGPVSSPYATIKPFIKPKRLLNKTLYLKPSKKNKEKI